MKRVDVLKKGERWIGQNSDLSVFATGRTQADAIRATAAKAKRAAEPVSVRIHGVDNRIREERTYPRSADPRRSRG
jgi:hypothetical protein